MNSTTNNNKNQASDFEVTSPLSYRNEGGIPSADPLVVSRWCDTISELDIGPRNGSVVIDYEELASVDGDLARAVRDEPGEFLAQGERAIREIWEDNDLYIRVINVPEESRVSDIRSSTVGKLIALPCTITDSSDVFERHHKLPLYCTDCSTHTTAPQSPRAEKKVVPYCDCGAKFTINKSKMGEYAEDVQQLTVQDLHEDSASVTPPNIVCDLEGDDLMYELQAGDRARLTGIVRRDADVDKDNEYYLHVVGVERENEDFDAFVFGDSTIRAIEDLSNREDIHDYLKESIAPSLQGEQYDIIREAVLLQLFGGVQKNIGGSVKRGDIHILLWGDPSTGKSQVADYAAELAPLSEFVSGENVSATGLTASCEHTDNFRESKWTLHAGTLPRAHKGLAALDELDKMSKKAQESLHQAMAKQVVNVSKIIKAELPSQCSVLAVGNPEDGRLEKRIPYAEQLNFSPTLISRFDLILPVVDDPGSEEDRQVTHDILAQYQTGGEPVVDKQTLTRYIAYARQNVHPSLTDESREYLAEKFNDLRADSADGRVSITRRQMDGMVRLAEASARVRLDEDVNLEDAKRAYNILLRSLKMMGIATENGMDVDVLEVGESASQRERKRDLWSILDAYEEARAPIDHILTEMVECGYEDTSKVLGDLETAVEQGDLFEPEDGVYVDSR